MNAGTDCDIAPKDAAPENTATDDVRFRFVIHYDGSGYHGWQVQPKLRTIQGEIEAVIARVAQGHRTVLGSGRTDRGVHATGQVASVDLPPSWTAAKLRGALNGLLPSDIWIAEASRIDSSFHPRYDALDRTYVYRIGIGRDAQSPFHRPWCWPLAESPQIEALQAAADAVVGDHSFQAFAKAGQPERGYRCTIHSAVWKQVAGGLRWTVTANRYLHHMVRYLVGTMVDIGTGARDAEDVIKMLAGSDRVTTSRPAPPEGLFLHRVRYAGDEEPSPSFDIASILPQPHADTE